MGCWNETCALSSLPIQEGEEIVLVLLREPCLPDFHNLYKPIFLPIIGTYNNYGGIENIQDTESSKLISVKFKSLNDKIHQENQYEAAFFHKDIYDEVLENVSNRNPHKQEKPIYNLMLESFENELKKVRQSREEIEATGDEEIDSALRSVNEQHNNIMEDIAWINLERINNMEDLKEMIQLEFTEKDDSKLIKEIINFVLFKMAMRIGRKYWMPSGSGSQSHEMHLQMIIASKTIKKIEEKIQQHKAKDASIEDMIQETMMWSGGD